MNSATEQLEIFYTTDIREKNWNIDHATGVWLAEFVKSTQAKSILELGTSIGVSASYMALSSDILSVTTVESNQQRFYQAKHNFEQLQIRNITQVQGHAPEILETLGTDYEIVFMDCIKHYYTPLTEYVVSHYPNLRYIIADNIDSHPKQLEGFMEYIKQFSVTKIALGDGLVVIDVQAN